MLCSGRNTSIAALSHLIDVQRIEAVEVISLRYLEGGRKRDGEVSKRSLFALGCPDKTDIEIYNAPSL